VLGDLEGIVAKKKAAPYAPSTTWWKIRNGAYTQKEGRGGAVQSEVALGSASSRARNVKS
jgi:hypothetical protein